MVVLDGRVAVLAQDVGARPPKISDNGDDFDSGGDSIRVTGGVEGAPAAPAAEAETAPAEVPAPATKALAAAPAPSPALSAPGRAAAPSRAIAAAPPSRPFAAARPAVPASPPAVAAAPAFAPEEPGIPVATSSKPAAAPAAASEEAAGTSSSEEAESAPAKSGTEIAKATPPSNGFPGSEFGANHGPIDIKSDTMALDYNGKSVIFTGHVRAIQAGGQLTSDKLKVAYGDNFHDVKEMFADGNVRISQGNRWETSDHAVLDQTKHTVVLTGSPVVHQGPDQITGKRITVHLDSGQSVVEGARAVIFPKSGGGETAAAGQQQAPPADGEPGEHLP